MAITREQALEAIKSCADVFTPEGDAGVISELRTFGGRPGEWAYVTSRHAWDWFELSDLDTAETLKRKED